MDIQSLLTLSDDAAVEILIGMAVKGALILGVAAIAAFALRRASASARHLVWLLAAVGVLAAPLLSGMTPPILLPPIFGVLAPEDASSFIPPPAAPPVSAPLPAAERSAVTQPRAAIQPRAAVQPSVVTQPSAVAPSHDTIAGASLASGAFRPTPSSAMNPRIPLAAVAPTTATMATVAPGPPAALAPERAPLKWLIVTVWLLTSITAGVRLAVGLALAQRSARRCAPVTDPEILAECESLAHAAGIWRRVVSLRQSAEISVPMTTGLLRPIVLLPANADTWLPARRQAALRHELAHVARGDWAWRALAGAVCALHWFNPMTWVMERQMREESERACDDAVLAGGARPTDYAEYLLETARQLSEPGLRGPGYAVAMARRSQVETRLRAILRNELNRGTLTPRRVLANLAVALLLLIPIAAIRTSAREWTIADTQAKTKRDNEALANLGEIERAILTYAYLHDRNLPHADRWMDEIAPYIDRGDPKALLRVMHDPSAPKNLTYTYAFNKALSGVNYNDLRYPDHVAMVYESTLGTRNANDSGESRPNPGWRDDGAPYLVASQDPVFVTDDRDVTFEALTGPPPQDATPLGTGSFTGRVVFEDGRPAVGVAVRAQILPETYAAIQTGAHNVLTLPNGKTGTFQHGRVGLFTNDSIYGNAAVSDKYFVTHQINEAPLAREQVGVTDKNGVYHLSGVMDVPYDITAGLHGAYAYVDGKVWTSTAIAERRGKEGAVVTQRDLVLIPVGFVTGQVKDTKGRLMVGGLVGSTGPIAPGVSPHTEFASTDGDGRYKIRVTPGVNHVFASNATGGKADITMTVAQRETKTADFQIESMRGWFKRPPRLPTALEQIEETDGNTSQDHLRTIGRALGAYAAQHLGMLPDADRWVDAIAPYIGNGDPKALMEAMRRPSAPASQRYGYAFNRSLSGVRLNTVDYPNGVPLVFESVDGYRNADDLGASVPGSYLKGLPALPNAGYDLSTVEARFPPTAGANYLFCDGAVRWVAHRTFPTFNIGGGHYATPSNGEGTFGHAELTGRVVMADGRPCIGLKVRAQMVPEETQRINNLAQGVIFQADGHIKPIPAGLRRPEIITDPISNLTYTDALTLDGGSFRLSGLTNGSYIITVSSDDSPHIVEYEQELTVPKIENATAREGKTYRLRDIVLSPKRSEVQ